MFSIYTNFLYLTGKPYFFLVWLDVISLKYCYHWVLLNECRGQVTDPLHFLVEVKQTLNDVNLREQGYSFKIWQLLTKRGEGIKNAQNLDDVVCQCCLLPIRSVRSPLHHCTNATTHQPTSSTKIETEITDEKQDCSKTSHEKFDGKNLTKKT